MKQVMEYKRIVDEIWEYCEWLNQVKRELRGADKRPTSPKEQDDCEEGLDD